MSLSAINKALQKHNPFTILPKYEKKLGNNIESKQNDIARLTELVMLPLRTLHTFAFSVIRFFILTAVIVIGLIVPSIASATGEIQSCSDYSGSWSVSGNTVSSTTNSGVGIDITMDIGTGGSWNNFSTNSMNTIDAWSESTVQGATALQSTYQWDNTPGNGYGDSTVDSVTGTFVIEFDTPVINPVIHFDRIGGFYGTPTDMRVNSSVWTLTTPSASLTQLSGTSHFIVEPQKLQQSILVDAIVGNSESSLDEQRGTAAGSVMVSGTYSQLAFDVDAIGVEGIAIDTFKMVLCVPSNPLIEAVDDDFSSTTIYDTTGGVTPSIIDMDTLDSVAAVIGTAVGEVTVNTSGNVAGNVAQDGTTPLGLATAPINGSITLNSDGTLTVAAGTTAGTYLYTYEICEVSSSANCDTAVATVVVSTLPIQTPIATDDSSTGNTTGTAVGVDPLDNDNDPDGTLDPTSVMLIDPDTSNPVTSVSVTGEGEWTVNPTTGEITFTPETGFTGDPTPITYTVDDNDGNTSNTATVTIDYDVQTPIATDDSSTGNTTGTAVGVDPLDNDNDPDGTLDPTSVMLIDPDTSNPVTSVSVTGEGEWTVNPTTGEITFTPETGFTGDPTPITYTVDDNDGNTSNTATVTIDYDVQTPIATDDSSTGNTTGTAVGVDPLDNDNDPDGTLDPTSVMLIDPDTSNPVTSVSVTGEGEWTVNPTTGEITFTPETGFTGDPTPITYTVDDNDGNTSNTATVTIDYDVQTPIATDDSSTGNTTGTAVGVDPLDNDNDPDGTLDPTSVMLIDPDTSNPVTSVSVTGEGEWTVNPTTGEITFTPETGFTGDPTPITYTVDDNDGNTSNTATVTIDYDVQTPIATDDSSTGNTTGTAVGVDPLDNDNDPDGTLDPTSVMLIDPDTSNPVTSVSVTGEGEWTVNPTTGEITFTPETGFTGDPTPITYTVDDNDGNTSNTATVTIDYDVQTPIATDDSSTGNITGTAVGVDPLGNDNDPDGTLDPTSVMLIDPDTSNPVTSVSVTGEGEWTVNPTTGEITFTPETGFTGDPTPITYTVDDNDGNTSNTASVTIDYDVQTPIATDDSSTGNTTGTAVGVDPLDNDNDPDGTLDPTSVMLIDPDTSNPVTSVSVTGEGEWTVNPTTGEITFTPETGFTGDPTPITYTVDDNDGNTSNTATVTIDYDVQTPIATDDSSTGNTTGTAVGVDPLDNDNDPDGTLDPTSVMLIDPDTSNPVTSVSVTGEGEWTVNPTTGEITFTPETGFTGDPTPITYTVDDNDGNTSNTATVTIDYDVQTPIATDDSSTGNTTGTAVGVDPLDNDNDPDGTLDPTSVMLIDPDTSSPVTSVSVTGEGEWTVNPTTGEITFTSETGFTGDPTPITYTVDDNDGNTSNTATVTIDYDVQTPIATDDSSTGNTTGTAVGVDPLDNDNDPDGTLDPTSVMLIDPDTSNPVTSVSVTGEGEWTVNPTTGEITFTPETGFTGDPTPISYTVDDNDGNTSNTATVTIDYDVQTPIATDDSSTGNTTGTAVGVDPLDNDNDPDGTLDPTSVMLIDPDTSNPVTSVSVTGEGEWTVNPTTGEITFTPETGFTGDPTPISYTVDDNDGNTSNTATVTIDYDVQTPIATDDSSTGNTTGTAVGVDPLDNDNDPDGTLDPTSVMLIDPDTSNPVTSVSVTGEGEWTVNPTTGEITFTPETGFTGDPTPITYTVDDNDGNTSNTATVTIDYDVQTPIATDDSSTGNTTGTAVGVDPLDNDNDPDGTLDPTSVMLIDPDTSNPVTSVSVTGEGEWTVNPTTGEITFTPETGFTGDPTPITYTVDDNDGNTSNTATVTIDYDVQTPIATDDSSTGNTTGTAVGVDPLDNDNDPDGTLDPTSVMLIDPDTSNPVTSVSVTGEGEWTVNPTTGEITFTPETGFTGDPTPITYTVDDNDGNTSNTATVTIDYDVQTPIATDDSSTGNTTGTAVGVDPLANDNDPDGTLDPTSVMLIDPDTSSPVTSVSVTGEGEWTVSPTTGEITFTPETGFTGDPTPITYTVDDNDGNTSNTATVTIDYDVQTPIATDDSSTGNTTGTAVGVDPLDNDNDPDGTLDPTSVMLIDPDTSSPVTSVSVTGEGEWTVSPTTGEITFTPETGFTGDPTPITYTVDDNDGNTSNTATVTIDYDVQTPIATDDSSTGNTTGTAVGVDPLDNDNDPDGTLDPTSVMLIDPDTSNPVTSVSVTGEGEWTVNPTTGEITFTPETGFTGDPTPITYTVDDNDGNTSNTATVTIDYDVQTPIATDDSSTGNITGTAVGVDPLGNDNDPDGTLDPTSVMLIDPDTSNPVTSVSVTGEGEWTVNPTTGEITFTPETGFTGDPTPITYTVDDNDGNTSNTASVTIDYDVQTPIATDDSSTGNTTGTAVGVDPLDNDNDPDGTLDPTSVMLIDPDTSNPVTSVSVTGEGEWTVNPTTGEITFTPETGFTGDPTPITYTVDDNDGNTSNTATVTIDYDVQTPIATDDSSTGNTTGTAVGVDPLDNDNDPDGTLDPTSVMLIDPDTSNPVTSVSVTGEGEWTVNPTTGEITFTPETGFTGDPTPITYTVDDNDGNTSNTATVTIDYDVQTPIATDDSSTGNTTGTAVGVDPLDNDNDPDGTLDPTSVMLIDPDTSNPVTSVSVTGEGEWTVNPTTGEITFTPETGFTGDPTPITYTVDDNDGNTSNTAIVTIAYEALAAITGVVWLDSDKDNQVDVDEDRKGGWILKIRDTEGNIVATTVTDAQGNYSITGLIPAEYTVEFYNPSETLIATQTTGGTLSSGQTMNLPLPIDPSGVIYDSTSRQPVEGVTLQLINSQGNPVDEVCLGEGQQNQVTTDDGIYVFDLYPDTHSSCPDGETYTINIVSAPTGYSTSSSIIPAQSGVYDSDANESNCTIDTLVNSGSCEVQGQPNAPQTNQDTTYFMDFTLNSGDSNVIFNHVPIDLLVAGNIDVDDNAVRLVKLVNKSQISIGDQLYYTISAENMTENTFDIDVLDDLPTGFKLVATEVKLTRAGIDALLGTTDDVVSTINATGSDSVRFGPITLSSKEKVLIAYLVKIGTATQQGSATNTAQAFSSGSETDIASNVANAAVQVIADSALDQSTLIGKVFHDRDEDGYQDSAKVTGLTVKSEYFGWNSLHLGGLSGRISVLDDPNNYRKIVRMPLLTTDGQNNNFKVTTQQGTVIIVDHNGQVKTAHTGMKKNGLTAQDIRVTTRKTRGIPTQTDVKEMRVEAKETDILEITLTNYGINEEGLPAVRLTTVEGLLIETDGDGRYHIPDIDSGRRNVGKNVIIKVDYSTLPQGAQLTTENPRVLRVTGSALNKINFGVKLPVKSQTHADAVSNSTLINGSSNNLRLPNGGVVWVTTDPVYVTPRLSVVSSKNVEMAGKSFKKPLNFTLYTNYAAFIDRWELNVYKGTDEDQQKPIARLSGASITNGQNVTWNGKTVDGTELTAGTTLTYILNVHDKSGHVDKTHGRIIDLINTGKDVDDKHTQNTIADNNNLRIQTIPLQGARVRIYGNDITHNQNITIDGEKVDIKESKFVIERLLPEGSHDFDLAIKGQHHKTYQRKLNAQVNGRYLFIVGIADLTVGKGKASGNIESVGEDDKYLDGDMFVDGRLAFYLRGKIKGKYLITAQMDTGTGDIDEIFDDLNRKDRESLFRRLDPEKYYPVYGDDSTLIDDTNSQGKMYVRVDWDKSQAIWGNFNTNITGTELSAFNRSLYGAKINYKSTKVTKDGNHKKDLTVFASETQNAFRHNQFLGTGGSLYYLKDTDIVEGSEKVWVEVRQRNSDRVVEQVVLQSGRDYEIDDFQGRLILHRPLLQIAEQANPSLIKDAPLDGNEVYLMVDYEYAPNNFRDKGVSGARGKAWLNDHLAVGGTYVHESRSDHDYDLKGVDVTLQRTKGTYIVAEYAETEALQSSSSYMSNDGGLQFQNIDTANTATKISGKAYSIEARTDLEYETETIGSLGAWHTHRDEGFSTARLAQGEEVKDSGVEVIVDINDSVKFSASASVYDKKQSNRLTSASVQGDYKVNDELTIGAELRRVKEEDQSNSASPSSIDGEGTLGAIKIDYDVNDNVNTYLIGQSTIEKSGNYRSNDLLTLGAKAKLNQKTDVRAEYSTGDRGDAGTLGIDYAHKDDHAIYTNYTHSTDTQNNERNLFTLGQRKSVGNRLNVFSEHQFTRETLQHGLGHNFGIDYNHTKDLTFSSSVQTANLEHDNGSQIKRQAFSVGLTYNKDNMDVSSRIENRRDKADTTAQDTEQWVSTSRINYRVNPSYRLQGKLNFSETKDQLSDQLDAKFLEACIGFAYRPIDNDRLNFMGRLTYVYDMQPLSQSSNVDEKSLTSSIEMNYQVNQRWLVGGKLANKQAEVRADRGTGTWHENDATLASAQVRYHIMHNLDATAQYHWLHSDESEDTQHGAMISIDRHIGKNMKIGVGYNFSEFDDDLNNTSGNAKGWFINLIGKF